MSAEVPVTGQQAIEEPNRPVQSPYHGNEARFAISPVWGSRKGCGGTVEN